MKVIGKVHSPFKEKFGIPRQGNLIDIPMSIEILPPYNREEAFFGLEKFSHAIIIFQFHHVLESEEKLSVRPPRLGGNTHQGVFATRSPYRPNRLGFSVVKLSNVQKDKIEIIGGDFLDQTPVLDIKPYLPYSDSIKDASGSWTQKLDEKKLQVTFECNFDHISSAEKNWVEQILSFDPRPTFHQDEKKDYSVKLFNYDFKFNICADQLTITEIKSLN